MFLQKSPNEFALKITKTAHLAKFGGSILCLLSSQAFKKLYRQYELNPNELRIPMSLLEIVVCVEPYSK